MLQVTRACYPTGIAGGLHVETRTALRRHVLLRPAVGGPARTEPRDKYAG